MTDDPETTRAPGSGPGNPITYTLEPADLMAYAKHIAGRPGQRGRWRRLIRLATVATLLALAYVYREVVWGFDIIGLPAS